MDIQVLNDYKRKGLIRNQKHPTLPLLIHNYSEICQYSKLWDDITSACRGLITDTEGNVVARSFPKFHNIEEGRHDPTPDFVVQEKLDGSLGILFYYADNWHFASRGSFTSEQALKAKELLDKKYSTETLDVAKSYIFEILYPENRIVVDYGDREELVYLASFKPSGEEYFEVDTVSKCGFPVVRVFEGLDYSKVKALDWKNSEGFVVRFSNGSRVKIKFANYVALHAVVTNLSTLGVWKWYREGKSLSEVIQQVPDEWHEWLKQTWNTIDSQAKEKTMAVMAAYEAVCHYQSRADFARAIKDNAEKSLIFALKDQRDIREMICDKIKPATTSVGPQLTRSIKNKTNSLPKVQSPRDPGKLIILCGISGSGKSTWARDYVQQNLDAVIVSRDNIRLLTWGCNDATYYKCPVVNQREVEVTMIEYELLQSHLDKGKTVIVDDTNLSAKVINGILKQFANYCVSFKPIELDVEVAVERDRHRSKSVGEAVIREQAIKHRQLHRIFDFSDRLPIVSVTLSINNTLPPAYVFDIDGTLAENVSGRSPYEWSRVGEDIIRDCVRQCVIALKTAGFSIIVCTGRDGVCRELTAAWLLENNVPFDQLMMRSEGDVRPDYVIKEEIWRELSTTYNIKALFDDRQQVVNHARRLGLQVFQVAPGNF